MHTNADALGLFDIGSYQVVTKKGEFKAGDLGVYVQPDSVIPQTSPFAFIWEAYVGLDGTVPEKRRRITVRKFRGEWSEGLLLPVTAFDELVDSTLTRHFVESDFPEGTDVAELLGITHYDPDAGKESAGDNETFKKAKRYPKSLRGWFWYILHRLGIYWPNRSVSGEGNEDGVDMPVYDVDALKNYKNAFEPGEIVEITEKIHGSNARFVFRDEHMFAGSRTQWKAVTANCIWRKVLQAQPWIEEWCRAHPGYGLYGEVTPTQGDKFQYGSKEPQLFSFDIRMPEGKWMDAEIRALDADLYVNRNWVPVLYTGPFDWEVIKTFVDGQTAVPGAKGIREGIVIRPFKERHVRGLGRLILKVVSNSFLDKDSKSQDKDGAPKESK
jgi:hypothetical protein